MKTYDEIRLMCEMDPTSPDYPWPVGAGAPRSNGIMQVMVNKKWHTVSNLKEARKVFLQRVSKRASRGKSGDGEVWIDDMPVYRISFNGRIWEWYPQRSSVEVCLAAKEIKV